MAEMQWGQAGEKRWETGVSNGALYPQDPETGDYPEGVAWNGLVSVTESPTGGESNKQYADNGVYANLKSAEEFGFTLEAFAFPDEFAQCDGSAELAVGVYVGQQTRRPFGFVWKSLVGNDLEGADYGYKLHLTYGGDAAPSEKANNTVNESPEAATMSWEVTNYAVPVPGTNPVTGKPFKPTAHITVDSTKTDPAKLAALEDILYGTVGDDPRLPLPAEVIALVGAGLTNVDLGTFANQPSYNSTTHVVTLPAVTGVQWKVNGVNKTPGAQPALAVGQTADVEATPAGPQYNLQGDDEWTYDY